MNWLILITILFCFTFCFYVCRENKFYVILLIIAIFIVSMPSILYPNALVFGHDLWMHINRIKGLVLNLSEFNIPYRINNWTFQTYGSQEPIFYPYMMLIIPSIIVKFFNQSIITVFNATFIIVNTLSALCMYFCVDKIYKNKNKAIISAIFYTLLIYRIGNIYTRNAFGEMFAMTFMPIYIYGAYELLFRDYEKYKYFVIGSTLIFMSHILSTVLAMILFSLMFTLNVFEILKNKKRVFFIFKSIVFIFLINSWYLFPFIYEHYNIFVVTPFKTELNPVAWQNFDINYFFKVFYNNQEYRGLGINIIISFLLVIIYYIKKIHIKFKFDSEFKLFIILILSLIFMLIPYDNISKVFLINKLVNRMQFSFRMLIIFLPILSMLFAYAIDELINCKKIILIFVFCISILGAGSYLFDVLKNGNYKFDDTDYVYINEYCLGETTLNKNYYSEKEDELDKDLFTNDVLTSANIKINTTSKLKNGMKVKYNVNNNDDGSYIEFPIFAYPSFVAFDENNNVLEIKKGFNNKVRVIPNKKSGEIIVKQREILFFLLGDFLSIFFIFFVLIYYLKRLNLMKSIIQIFK